jgi:4-amino-4-deoxy-L-arabinose transferase-like glycosyltransferase
MNEASLICLTFASYRLAQRRLATGSRRALVGLGLCTTLIALVKIPYLIVWAGIAGLYAETLGVRALRRVELALVGLVNVGLAYLWYSHAHALAAETGLSFGMTDKLYSSSVVFTTLFLRRVGGQIRQDVLGLPSLLLLVVGLVIVWRRGRRFEPFAFAGFLAYVVILARGCMVHDYYLLAVVPVAAVLVPVGLCAVAERIGRGKGERELVAIAVLTAVLVLYSLFRSIGPHSWYDTPVDKVQLCRAGRSFLAAGDRLAFVGYENPDLLYCLDRRGWLLEAGTADAERLGEVWRLGATVFVLPRALAWGPAGEWIRERGSTAFENAGFVVARLPPPPAGR